MVGEIPPMTFIQRLVAGLAGKDMTIYVFGSILRKPKAIDFVTYIGEKKYQGIIGKLIFRNKYHWLVRLFRPRQYEALKKLKPNADDLDFALLWSKPGIVHVQWAKSLDNFMWVQHFGIKLVLSLRGAHINYSPITVPGLAEKYLTNFPLVDGFHGVSQAICEEASKYGASLEKCKVVYSGFNLNDFPWPNLGQKYQNIRNRKLKIVSVGRAHWVKGYPVALDAMHQLKQEELDFQYSIIGAGKNEELIFQVAQLGLEQHVEMTDKMPFDKVKKRIQEADVLLLSSSKEGIANVVIEAMLLGTLVVTTDCGGMTETVTHGETGWVVPVRNPEAIAKTIVELKNTSPEKLVKMVEGARQKAEEQHNENRMVASMLALYNRVLQA